MVGLSLHWAMESRDHVSVNEHSKDDATGNLNDNPGALFITAYQGAEPDADFLRLVAKYQPAGIIVFADNCDDIQLLKSSIAKIQELSGHNAFIAIDQEGGRVLRLKQAALLYPAAAEYGRQAERESIETALESYRVDLTRVAEGLVEIGINLLLGPVCDLAPDSENSALNERTFSSDPAVVSEFVKVAVQTQRRLGLISCLKHAPGLGRVQVDPHQELGASKMTYDEFDRREAQPFRAGISEGAEMVMTSHFLLPDEQDRPVTFSSELVRKFITDGISADAVLVSDDLQMGALERFGSDGERAALAIAAGHDIALTRNARACLDGIKAVRRSLESGLITSERYRNAEMRVQALRARLGAREK
jgi:beta-N-acetylhexosaminidase